jgi:hypothetical protein
MSPEISGSVGRWENGARNLQADVRTVQRLLKTAAKTLEAPEIDPKDVDGKISRPPATSNTVNAIEAFQSRFTGAVDGVIAPGSQRWAALLRAVAKTSDDQENVSGVSQQFFPFTTVPAQKLGKIASRVRFAASRRCQVACWL